MVELHEHLREADRDPDCRIILLEGAGEDFCAGDNEQDMGPWPELYAHRRPSGGHGPAPLPAQDLLTTLREIETPTLALLRGKVWGLGLDIAAAADIRLATTDVNIRDGRVEAVRYAATGITYLLPRLIGLSQSMRLMLLGDAIDGREAARIGLVLKAVEPDEFEAAAAELTAQISTMATRSYGIVKQQIVEQLDLPFRAALAHSMAVRQTNVIEDREEGARAFLEKRQPNYKGR